MIAFLDWPKQLAQPPNKRKTIVIRLSRNQILKKTGFNPVINENTPIDVKNAVSLAAESYRVRLSAEERKAPLHSVFGPVSPNRL